MKPLICKQCGGALDRESNTCPYCGTGYTVENAVVQSLLTAFVVSPAMAEELMSLPEFFSRGRYPEGMDAVPGEIGRIGAKRVVLSQFKEGDADERGQI